MFVDMLEERATYILEGCPQSPMATYLAVKSVVVNEVWKGVAAMREKLEAGPR
jgi:hypothetical protein